MREDIVTHAHRRYSRPTDEFLFLTMEYAHSCVSTTNLPRCKVVGLMES